MVTTWELTLDLVNTVGWTRQVHRIWPRWNLIVGLSALGTLIIGHVLA